MTTKEAPAPQQASSGWRTQVAEMHILNRYLLEAIRLQQTEPAVRRHGTAGRLVAEIHARLQRNNRELAASFPVELKELRPPSASLAGLFIHFFSKARAHDLSSILRNDLVLLTFAAGNCSLLHATSLALGQAEAAELALAHARALAGLCQKITLQLPAVAVTDSLAPFDGSQDEVAKAASANVGEAWGFVPPEPATALRAAS